MFAALNMGKPHSSRVEGNGHDSMVSTLNPRPRHYRELLARKDFGVSRASSPATRRVIVSDNQLADLARNKMIRNIVESVRTMPVGEVEIPFIESLGLPIDDDVKAHDAIMRGFDKALKQVQAALENLY